MGLTKESIFLARRRECLLVALETSVKDQNCSWANFRAFYREELRVEGLLTEDDWVLLEEQHP